MSLHGIYAPYPVPRVSHSSRGAGSGHTYMGKLPGFSQEVPRRLPVESATMAR